MSSTLNKVINKIKINKFNLVREDIFYPLVQLYFGPRRLFYRLCIHF